MSDLSVIKKLKVAELKAALSARGLAVKGKKDELVKRLAEAMEADEQQTEEPEVAEEAVEDSAPEEVSQEKEPDDTSQMNEEAMEDDESPESKIAPPEDEEEVNNEETEPTASDEPIVSVPVEEPIIDDEPESIDSKKQDGKGEEDWVMVEAPSTEETSAVEEASESQDNALQAPTENDGSKPLEPSVSDQPLQEPTVDTPSETTTTTPAEENDVEMKTATEDKQEDTTAASTEPKPERSEEVPPEKAGEKSQEGEVSKEKTEEKKPEKVEIPEVMVEVEVEEGEEFVSCEVPEGQVGLDQYTSDLNFVVHNNGLSGRALIKNGFAYMWAGARANKGAKGGKVGYEVKITKFEEVELPEEEAPVNAIRIGWSAETTDLQLGEASLSYGFESTGKVCASSSFFQYGVEFGVGDVIGTYLDLESEPKTLKYTKNGDDLGVAMSLTVNLEEKPLFPHILVRNVAVDLNFGSNEAPWFETPEGYSLIQNGSEEQTTSKTSSHKCDDQQKSEIIMMVGLPSSGKSSWVRKYCDSHPEKYYNVIGMNQLLDRCKLEGKKRKKSDKNHEEIMKNMMKVLTKLYQLCPTRTRNFIYDQNNVYKVAQEKKMAVFASGFKRKGVVIVPTHDNLRRRTSEAKRKGDSVHDVPFGDLCDMKCEFHIPETGEFFDEVIFPELDERNAGKTVRDYQSDGSRAKKTGRDDYYPKKRQRYDDRRRDHRYGDRDRRGDGWRGSGSGYGGYRGGSYGGGYHKRNDSGGYKGNRGSSGNYNDPYRRHSGGSGGGGYRQNSYGSGGGGGYRSGGYNSGGGYGQSYGSSGYGQSYGAYGSQQSYGGSYGSYNYGNYNQTAGNRSTSQWGTQQQYGAYNQSQATAQSGWGTGGQWAGYNYSGTGSYNTGSNNYGGNTGSGGYSY